MGRSKAFIWAPAFFIICITFSVYLSALQNGFVNWDDHILVYENPNIKSIDVKFIRWALTAETDLWIPLTLFSFAIDHAIWGLNPVGYHLTNVIFHAANSFLVFVLTISLLTYNNKLDKKNIIAGIVTSLLFCVHPLHVESVAWVAERKDVLYAFFFLLSLIAYLRYVSTNSKRYYLLSLIFFIFSLMSKPMAVSLPLVLLILDSYPLRRLTIGRGLENIGWVLIEKIPFLLLSLFLSLATVWIHPLRGGWDTFGIYPLIGRLFTAAHILILYLVKMFLPFNLAPLYPSSLSYSIIEYTGSFVFFIIITFYAFHSSKRKELFSIIWLYYIVTLIPVLGILARPGDQLVADRYTYLPSLGPFILAGLGIGVVFEQHRWRQLMTPLLAVLVLLAGILVSRTIMQIPIWRDSRTLWSYETKLFPDTSWVAYNNLGLVYYGEGRFDEAIMLYQTSIKLNPLYAKAHNNLGLTYYEQGRFDEAIQEYEIAIRLNPIDPTARYNLGIAYYKKTGKLSEAAQKYTATIKLTPGDKIAHYNLGTIYYELGKLDKAIEEYMTVLKNDPDYSEAHTNLGNIYYDQDNIDKALQEYLMAIKLNPNDAIAHYNIGLINHERGRLDEAIQEYQFAISINSEYLDAHYNLGLAYWKKGLKNMAIKEFEAVLKINPDFLPARKAIDAI